MAIKLLMSLDELLDTRLGLITAINPDVAGFLISDKEERYFRRIHDEKIAKELGWTYGQWKEVYAKRDANILRLSIVTNLSLHINDIIDATYKENYKEKLRNEFIVDVNLHPYTLTNDELIELKNILKTYIPLADEIVFINKPLSELTCAHIKNEYTYIIMYDFHGWMDLHGKALQKFLMPQCTFFVPRLMYELWGDDRKLTKEERQFISLDPYKVFEVALGFKIGLKYLPVLDFCPIFKPTLDTSTPRPDLSQTDLDSQPDLSAVYTPDNSQLDLQSLFRQGLGLSEESEMDQEVQK